MNKRVVAVVESGPNYPFHLLAVARLGFASGYADRHRASVQPEDLAFLRENAGLLTFGDGRLGRLVPLAIFLPAYLGLDSREAIGEYFDLLVGALAGGETDPFCATYAGPLARLGRWIGDFGADWLSSHADLRPVIRRLGGVFRHNHAAYLGEVWPWERLELETAADRLNAYFSATDLIGRWEGVTGLEFKAERYDIILSTAIENGPNANSLGYERTVFRPGPDFTWATQFVGHEVGTHLLIDVLREAMPEHDFDLLYRAYECLARFYNRRVLGEPLVYTLPGYGDEEFGARYAALQAGNPRATPGDLLQGALG